MIKKYRDMKKDAAKVTKIKKKKKAASRTRLRLLTVMKYENDTLRAHNKQKCHFLTQKDYELFV